MLYGKQKCFPFLLFHVSTINFMRGNVNTVLALKSFFDGFSSGISEHGINMIPNNIDPGSF